MQCLLPCLLLAATVDWASGARILAVLPMPARSHHVMLHSILKTLAQRGHQVVNYSPFPLDKPIANYTDVFLDNIESVEKFMSREMLTAVMSMSPVGAAQFMWKNQELSTRIYNNSKVQQLIQSNERFDLVMLECLFASESLLAFGHRFKAPVINLHPFGAFSLGSKASGNSLPLSYIPDYAFPYSDHMSFYERLLNTYSILSSLYKYHTQFLPTQDEVVKSVFKDPTMPSVADMLYNISLFVNNAHPYVHYAQPYTPNIVPVGGIHLSAERKPLPPVMKKFADEAKDGLIYFSLGSVVPDKNLPQEFFDMFLSVFRRLPQRVLWKVNRDLGSLPNNVLTVQWAPQLDLLAHPNLVVFMTHGGLFSQHEAIYAGVPVVCIPLIGDQPLNAKFYEEKEIGVRLFFDTLSEDTIYSALTTVLDNPKYKQNMVRVSSIYRDRPVSAADSLVFWVEYVLRHRGAGHLRPASTTLAWYQLALLDILAAILAAFLLFITLLYLFTKTLVRLMCATKNSSTTQRTKKNN